MKWANEFYPVAKEEQIGIDALNLHAYQMNADSEPNGPCHCSVDLLRDQLSYIYTKFGFPIWLTEFNCGNGFWNCPMQAGESFSQTHKFK